MKAWCAGDQDALRGLCVLEPLDWDSRVLGFSAARLDVVCAPASEATTAAVIEPAIAAARHLGIRHLSARVDAADDAAIHALEAAGFLNVDALLTFAAGPTVLLDAAAHAGIPMRIASPADASPVAAIAERAFRHGRFHSDPDITPERASGVYRTWATACCEGSAADAVIVAEPGGEIAGFVACRMLADTAAHLDRATGTIPLIATSERSQGQGIGAALVAAAAAWFRGRQAAAVEIGTQLRNVPAARLYERCGFRLVGGSLSFRLMIHP